MNFVTVEVGQGTCVLIQRVSGLYTGSECTGTLVARCLRAFSFWNVALSIVQPFETSGTGDPTTQRHSPKEVNFQYNAVKTSCLANYEHEKSGNVQNVQTQQLCHPLCPKIKELK